MRKLALVLILIIALPVYAEANQYASGVFWTALKVQLVKHLEQKLDSKKYKYEIIGPTRELKNFLGNRADATIKFDKLLLESPSPLKTIVAYIEDANGKRTDSAAIQIDLWVYKPIYKLRQAISAGQEIQANNIIQSTEPIRQMDEKLYIQGNLRQKVATSNIPANTPIKVNMLRHQKLIQVGDMIRVNSGSKAIKLEFICKAMNSGDIGGIINLNCPEMNQKNHRAEVTAAGEARLL